MLNFFPCCLLENLSWMVRVLLFVIYTKQIKYTVNTDTSAFNWALHNAGYKKKFRFCLHNFISQTLSQVSLGFWGWFSFSFFFFVCESFYLFFFSPFSSDYLFRTGKQCMNEWLKLLREEEDCTVKFLFWKKLLKLLCMHWKSWHRQWTLMYFSQIWECWMRYSFCPLFLSFISLSWTKQYKTWISFLTTESERIDSQMYKKQNIIPC